MIGLILAGLGDWISIGIVVALVVAGLVAWFQLARIGIYVGLVLICIAVGIFAHRRGAAVARAECNAAAIQSKLDAANADLALTRRAAADAERRSAALDAANQKTTEKIDDMERELTARDAAQDQAPVIAPAPVDGKCPVPPRSTADRATDADVRRLRAIAR